MPNLSAVGSAGIATQLKIGLHWLDMPEPERSTIAMMQTIGQVSLLVRDYDEAIEYFTQMLDFRVVEDTAIESEGKRWVVIAPPGSTECRLLLAQPRREADVAMIGCQAGRRVFLFLHTDDFWRDYPKYLKRGVQFCEEPRVEAYGTVVVFEDLYGNRWDLLEQQSPQPPA